MILPRTFAIFALLAVATAGPTIERQAGRRALMSDVKKILPLRRSIWDHYGKEAKEVPVEKIIYYENILEQCWVEVTDTNYRVIIRVNDAKKSDLRVILKNSFMIVEETGYEEFSDTVQDKKVLNKFTFTEVRSIPTHSVVTSVTATVTSDGYLVVDFPIDEKVAKPALGEREVPIVESEKPLESERVTTKQLTFMQYHEMFMQVTYLLLFKILAMYFNVESEIEETDDNMRVILKVVNAKNNTKNDVTVDLRDGVLYIYSRFVYEQIDDPMTNFVCDSYILPQNAIVASATATLTSDDYLVVDIPIDTQTEILPLGRRNVPVVECGKSLEEWRDSIAISDLEEVADDGNDNDNDNGGGDGDGVGDGDSDGDGDGNGNGHDNDHGNDTDANENQNDNDVDNGKGNYNDNDNTDANEKQNDNDIDSGKGNDNDNTVANENQNDNDMDNGKGDDNDNTYANENQNDKDMDNGKGNDNDNTDANEYQKDNVNTDANENDSKNKLTT